MTDSPRPFQWDFYGDCAPDESRAGIGWKTFTLGIFQWLPKASGKGLKRGKVIQRVKGTRDNPALAYRKAREVCARLNMGDGTA
jgi:predicted RecA/RadA family phage recombinase